MRDCRKLIKEVNIGLPKDDQIKPRTFRSYELMNLNQTEIRIKSERGLILLESMLMRICDFGVEFCLEMRPELL